MAVVPDGDMLLEQACIYQSHVNRLLAASSTSPAKRLALHCHGRR